MRKLVEMLALVIIYGRTVKRQDCPTMMIQERSNEVSA